MCSENSKADTCLVVALAEKSDVLRTVSKHLLVIVLQIIGEVQSGIWEDLTCLVVEDLVVSLRKKALIGLIHC